MTNDELERAMQFILNQQAQFAADQQQVNERVSRLETNMAELAQAQTQLTQVQAQAGQTQAQMGQVQAHLNEVLAAMLEAHKHTEEKLDAFIGVLERYISEDRNGKTKGGSAK
jgi:predicted transcriptional regulator